MARSASPVRRALLASLKSEAADSVGACGARVRGPAASRAAFDSLVDAFAARAVPGFARSSGAAGTDAVEREGSDAEPPNIWEMVPRAALAPTAASTAA